MDPAMRPGVPCNENRFFPMRIDLHGVSCKPYRVWVYSALIKLQHFYRTFKKYFVSMYH